MPEAIPPPPRVYTCYIDGILHTQAFPHGELTGAARDKELNSLFQAWLEMKAPGAYAEGRVTGIRFADMPE